MKFKAGYVYRVVNTKNMFICINGDKHILWLVSNNCNNFKPIIGTLRNSESILYEELFNIGEILNGVINENR